MRLKSLAASKVVPAMGRVWGSARHVESSRTCLETKHFHPLTLVPGRDIFDICLASLIVLKFVLIALLMVGLHWH